MHRRYRNPFLTAKAALSVHVLSGERLILGVSTGYLEPEFRALGVDFDERNDLADEGLVAMRRAWTEDGVEMTGMHFHASGHTMLPHPEVAPPMWVGGNSKRAIRRAVDLADGWLPMPYPRDVANPRRSAFLETTDELRALLAYADEYRDQQGSTRAFTVSLEAAGALEPRPAGLRPGATPRPHRRAARPRCRRHRGALPRA